MTDSMKLKRLKVSGFRGFASEETIDLTGPVVILAGGNRSGKSSTLNAIEWVLYGEEVVGSGKVNIDERKSWLLKNLRSDRASVELLLSSGGGDIVVRRSAAGATGKKSPEFYFVDENGERHDREEDLWARLGLGPKDFMSSAYLHQEVIRDLLVTQPAVRKAALDRLLGVSDLRNLFDAFKAVKATRYEAEIDRVFSELEESIALKAGIYQKALAGEMEDAARRGLEEDDCTTKGFSGLTASIVDRLRALGSKAGVPALVLEACGPLDFHEFEEAANSQVDRLRAENPGARSQQELDRRARGLDRALSLFQGSEEDLGALLEEKSRIEREHGKAADIRARVEELERASAGASAELVHMNDRINVVNETIAYLERLDDRRASAACPACGGDIIPGRLLDDLREVKRTSAEQTGELEDRRKKCARDIKTLTKHLERLDEIASEELPEAEKARDARLEELEQALQRKLGEDEDPEIAVESSLAEIEKAVEKNRGRLEEYTAGFAEVSGMLAGARSVAGLLRIKRRIKELNAIRESPEWSELRRARDEMFEELEHLEKVRQAVEEVLGEVSRAKVNEARAHITSIYARLVERPDFSDIEIDPDKNYEVFARDGSRRERLVSFFNQGDMNCAALAIFLALSTGRVSRDGGASFLMMDDPSQSLDRVQKERLARVLNDITGDVQLLLATMDNELLESAKNTFTRKKRVYALGAWDPKTGPDMTEE